MHISDADIAKAAPLYERAARNLNPRDPTRREAQIAFDVLCGALLEKAKLNETAGIERPTAQDFKKFLIKKVIEYLRRENP